MADFSAAFFANSTTQRPDLKSRKPSSHATLSVHSQAQPIKPLFKKGSLPKLQFEPRPSKTDSCTTGSPTADGGDEAGVLTLEAVLPTHGDMLGSIGSRRAKPNRNETPDGTAALSKSTSPSSGPPQTAPAERKNGPPQVGTQRDSVLLRSDTHGRTGSISSNSMTASSMHTSGTTGDAPSSDMSTTKPFTRKHGRRYLGDPTLPYPLPCDLPEIHRQTLQTMLFVQVLGGPICSPTFKNKAPKRVLEVACGTGYWSSLCHQHYTRKGSSVCFTGVDIVSLATGQVKDPSMKWTFVQHDLRKMPLPFEDDEFDLIMVKDLSLVTPTTGMQQNLLDEYLRILQPTGVLEIWDSDHTIRMLLSHDPPQIDDDDSESEDEDQARANFTGTYTLTAQTPFASAQNAYLAEYNSWIIRALEARQLTHIPSTDFRPMLLAESEDLTEVDYRRLAIPLCEVRWERKGIGGNITQDGSGNRSSDSSGAQRSSRSFGKKGLSTTQAAIRQTALLTVVQKIEALAPLLREASGKGQDEWERWISGMTNDLLGEQGACWGECLELGAWWARKKKSPQPRRKSPTLARVLPETGKVDKAPEVEVPFVKKEYSIGPRHPGPVGVAVLGEVL